MKVSIFLIAVLHLCKNKKMAAYAPPLIRARKEPVGTVKKPFAGAWCQKLLWPWGVAYPGLKSAKGDAR